MPKSPLLDRLMELKDPRQSAKCTHNLGEVIFMATCALLCGADDWNAIAFFAKVREGWFRQYLTLPREFNTLPPSGGFCLGILFINQ